MNMPGEQKPMCDAEKIRRLDPRSLREYLNEGNFGGLYQRQDDEMMKIWGAGVEETRALLEGAWD
jgi:creatinine amidohydrolase